MNLLKALATISSMTMLSRITGLIREVLIARAFGASGLTDAFFVAFRIPNLLRRLFAEGAFSQAFVPILAEYKNQQGEAETRKLVDYVASALFWSLFATCVVGMIAAPIVVLAIATGLKSDATAFDASVMMTRIMFPYIGFMSLVALAGGVLNTWREFRIPAFTPVLLNISFIVAALFVAPQLEQPIYALAFAVFVGGVFQLGIQVPALIKIGMLPRLSLNPIAPFRNAGVKRVIRQMVPATFAVSVAQISLMINTNIASHLDKGSVSWISYADRLMEFPAALLGVALGTILLPSLSKAHTEGDQAEYSALLDWGLRLIFLLALPAAVMMLTISTPMTAVLFHYGKFGTQDVVMTGQAVIAYGVGLIGVILVRVLAPGFYAKQDIKTPVKIAVGVLIATQAMNAAFVPFFAHAGLALAIGLGGCINAIFLYWGLRRRGIYTPLAGWLPFLMKLVCALTLLGATAWWGAGQFDWLALQAQPLMRVGALSLVMAGCGVVYFGVLLALGFRIRDFRRTGL